VAWERTATSRTAYTGKQERYQPELAGASPTKALGELSSTSDRCDRATLRMGLSCARLMRFLGAAARCSEIASTGATAMVFAHELTGDQVRGQPLGNIC
jgi:hypothetical protein